MTDVDNSTQPSHQQQDVHNMTSLSGQTFSNITSTDAPSSAAISTAIVILLSSVVVVLLLIVLVLLLLWKKESVMNCFSCFRKQRASRKSNGSVVLESGGLDDVANGRRLAAQGTMPYLEEEVANSRNGNSHPAHDTSQNGNSDANHNVPVAPKRRHSLIAHSSAPTFQNDAYEDVINVSMPPVPPMPTADYENVALPTSSARQAPSDVSSRNSQYSTTSEEAQLLSSKSQKPSVAAVGVGHLDTIIGSHSGTMSLVDESAYATPDELLAVIQMHAAGYENLGVGTSPLKPPLKSRTDQLQSNLVLTAQNSDASTTTEVERIYADDYYDNTELTVEAAVRQRYSPAVDGDTLQTVATGHPDNNQYEVVDIRPVEPGHSNLRHSMSHNPTSRAHVYTEVSLPKRVVGSGSGEEKSVTHDTTGPGLAVDNTTRHHGYEEIAFPLKKSALRQTTSAPPPAPHQTYERLTTKQYRLIPSKEIYKLELVGKGAFGEVWLGNWKSSDDREMRVAVKRLHNEPDSLAKSKLHEEADLLGRFHHENIVQLFGVTETDALDDKPQLVLEWAERGSLLGWLRRTRPREDESVLSLATKLVSFCADIASGLAFLQKVNFIHRDLAARNILLGSDYTCKICDFGMSKVLAVEAYYSHHGGKLPVKWSPPEVILKRKFSLASDIWSFAVVMYEIWSLGRKPYFPWPAVKVADKVCAGYRLASPPGCPIDVYKIMMDCWSPGAAKRPTPPQLVERLKSPELHLDADILDHLGIPHDSLDLPQEFTVQQKRYQKPPVAPKLSKRS